jgi:hypothetical protein
MSLINDIADKIAHVRGHDRAKCNDKCQCYPLALDIVSLFERTYSDDRNRLTQMLADRTDELIRLKRLVGDEA